MDYFYYLFLCCSKMYLNSFFFCFAGCQRVVLALHESEDAHWLLLQTSSTKLRVGARGERASIVVFGILLVDLERNRAEDHHSA